MVGVNIPLGQWRIKSCLVLLSLFHLIFYLFKWLKMLFSAYIDVDILNRSRLQENDLNASFTPGLNWNTVS